MVERKPERELLNLCTGPVTTTTNINVGIPDVSTHPINRDGIYPRLVTPKLYQGGEKDDT